jgi:transposase
MIADRGDDADWFREALKDKELRPCIPGRKSRGKPVDKRRHRSRNGIEIKFGRLKDWRRVAACDDRCAKAVLSAVVLAATIMFWLCPSKRLEPRKTR